MPDVLLAVVPGDDDTLHVTVDPAGLIDQLAELFADDSNAQSIFSTLVLAKDMLRKPRLDEPTRTYWEARHSIALTALSVAPEVQQTLTAVITSKRGFDLVTLLCDAESTLEANAFYNQGLNDEPDRELLGARAVEDR